MPSEILLTARNLGITNTLKTSETLQNREWEPTGYSQVYLQQQEGGDNVVSHVEIIPSAGFVQRKPFQGEDDLRREGKCWDRSGMLSWASGGW